MDRFIFQSYELDDQQPPIEEILSFPIQLTDRIRTSATDSKSFKLECAVIGKQVDRLSQMLRSVVRFANSTTNLYERPVRRIFIDVARNLNRALTLLRKCRRGGIFWRFVSIVTLADFRKVFNLLDVSIGDMTWLISVFNDNEESGDGAGAGIIFTLPPIASNNPILAWIWSYIASLHLCSLTVKIEVAHELCSLAHDNDRNKNMIVEEGGISPLLKLLKEDLSLEAQIAGALALFNLANDQYRARLIFNEHAVPIIVQVFRDSPILVQIQIANLIARMAKYDSVSQEGFARENVIGILVTFLTFDVFLDDDDNDDRGKVNKFSRKSIGSVDEITKLLERSSITSNYRKKMDFFPSSMWSKNRKDNENDTPQLILEFKTNCSGALWMLARGSIENCRKITETKGLLCLAKLIEREKEELQINCLMTVLEITSAAEFNPDFRRSAFKTSSPAAQAVAEQLIRLINQSDNLAIKIPAIQAIGHLARTFPARQTQQVIGPLVKQLCHRNSDVITESVIALGKFTCPENYLSAEHSKTVVDFEGVQPVMRLLRGNERTQYHALKLLCYLSMHAGNSESFQRTRLLTALEGADKSVACQYSELRELVAKAIHLLNVSHAGVICS